MTRYEYVRILGTTEQYNWFKLVANESTRFDLLTQEEYNNLPSPSEHQKRFDYLQDIFYKNYNRYRYTHNKYTLKRHLIAFGYNPKYCGKTKTYYVKNLNPKHLDIIKEHYNVNINVEDDKANYENN